MKVYMKTVRLFLIFFFSLSLITSCRNQPNGPFDISFHHETEVVVPAEGGTYTFTVEAVKTKSSWFDILGYIEFKVHIDDAIVSSDTRQICKIEDWINDGDTFEVWFDIPKNNTNNSRDIFVKANVISHEDFWSKSYVIGDDAHWIIVWQGTQLAP